MKWTRLLQVLCLALVAPASARLRGSRDASSGAKNLLLSRYRGLPVKPCDSCYGEAGSGAKAGVAPVAAAKKAEPPKDLSNMESALWAAQKGCQDCAARQPFVVAMRVEINDGPNNAQLAKTLADSINTPGSTEAGIYGFSVARAENNSFPNVVWPTTTTMAPGQVATAMPVTDVPSGPGLTNFGTTPFPASYFALRKAMQVADENKELLGRLQRMMSAGSEAHSNGLLFGNPQGTTPMPTEAPPETPKTFGRLIYDAFLNTPAPPEGISPRGVGLPPGWPAPSQDVLEGRPPPPVPPPPGGGGDSLALEMPTR